MKKPVVLRIFKGDQLQGVKQFSESQIVLGRPGDVQVALDGDRVSLIHAAIEERESGYFICDLGSEAGTFKNGEAVLDAPIESGDIVQVGEFRIEFYIGVPKPKAPPSEETKTELSAVRPPEKPVSAPPPVSTPAPVQKPTPLRTVEPVKPSDSRPTPKPVAPTPIATPSPIPSPLGMPSVGAGVAAAGGFSLAGPKARAGNVGRASHSELKKHRFGRTFAPASKYSDVKDFVKPSKGTVVEVLVAWGERVIATHHFSGARTVTMGTHSSSDIQLPVLAGRSRKVPLVKIDMVAKVIVTPEMTGELIRGQSSSSFSDLLRQNRLMKEGAQYAIALDQGEMVKLQINEHLSVVVRYVSETPKPLIAPLLDLTTSEFTGVVLAVVLIAILRLYTFLYTPPVALPDEELSEPMRTAIIIAPPTPPPIVPPTPPQPVVESTPAPTPPPQVVRATPAPKPIPVPARAAQPKASTNLTTKNDPGASANAAPNKNKTGPRTLTSPKQGGSIKTTDKPAAQMQSKSRDVSKSGVFSVFGNSGANNELAQSTTGSGELAGLANAATGKSGYGENRAGQGLGSDVKDTGVGGTGKALVGINGGVGTAGRGSGNSGYGTGGLGNKAGTRIVTGGEGEDIPGSIDREAIRRVILANLRVIRTCYERELNKNPDLFGKIVLSWEIGEQGRVLSAKVKSNELGNPDVANCIMNRLKTWKFPDPPANQVVEVGAYPFFFSN